MSQEKILVIRQSALGDLVLATAAMKALRGHHPDAHISLLVASGFAKLFSQCPYVDELILDTRPKMYHFIRMYRLIKQLVCSGFSRVYDLQCTKRTAMYFKWMRLFNKTTQWVGWNKIYDSVSSYSSRNHMVVNYQLMMDHLGIKESISPDLTWAFTNVSKFNLPEHYVVLVSGVSDKSRQWPVDYFAELAKRLIAKGITSVLVGTKHEKDDINAIALQAPGCINLCDQTNLFELITVCGGADIAIGNDTGPMHIAGAAGVKYLISLFPKYSDPYKKEKSRPYGDNVVVLEAGAVMSDISVNSVEQEVLKCL